MSDRLDEVLPLVTRPVRYTDAEFNARTREPAPGTVRWVLGMPEVYELGASNYGLRILYSILNRTEGALCDRVYAPWPDFGALLRERGIPLYALESKRPVREFDILGLSLQSELCCTNVPYLLELAGIPVRAGERGPADPLVVAGGPCTVNPLPLESFFDAFVIGDGEEVVVEITRARQGRDRADREGLRAALARVPGVYVPGHSPRTPGAVRRRFVAELRDEDFPLPPLVPTCEVTHDRLTLEIARGCTRGCRFCQAGMLNRPVRFRTTEQVLALAERGIRESGWEEISLLSLSALDHPDIAGMVSRLNEKFRDRRVAISLPSTRGEDFSAELAFDLQEVKKTGLTFAPETASPRLKALVNKNISELRTLEAVRTAMDGGWNGVKLYFMVGLPTETDADLDELVRFVAEVGRTCRGRAVRYNLSAFVPKPHTPLQWAGFAGIEELRAKLGYVRSRLTRRNLKAKWEDPAGSFLQAVLARGDGRLGPVIEHVYRAGGLFQEWSEHFDFGRWQAAFEACGVDPAPYVAAREPGAPLAWDFIDVGVSRAYLAAEAERAARGEMTPDCADDLRSSATTPAAQVEGELVLPPEGTPGRSAGCTGCGVCPGGRPPARPEPAPALARAYRRRFQPAGDPVWPGGPEPAPKVRMRVRHAVGEGFRWAGHLDRVRALYRALRRSGLPVAYTRGFSPKPMLSFGPPLPVGLFSDGEYFDLHLRAGYAGDLTRDLGPFLPAGLELVAARAIARERPTLGKEINLGRYRVGPGAPDPAGAAERGRQVPGMRAARANPDGTLEFELSIAPGVRLFPALARLTGIEEPAVRTLEVRRLDCLIDRGGATRPPMED